MLTPATVAISVASASGFEPGESVTGLAPISCPQKQNPRLSPEGSQLRGWDAARAEHRPFDHAG